MNRMNIGKSGRRCGQKSNRKLDYIELFRDLGFYLECDRETLNF